MGAFTAGAAQYGMVASAVAGGIASKVQGGNFGHGFWAAGLGAGIGGGAGQGWAKVVTAAVVGGTISKLTGGKFKNGAISAAFAAAMAADWGSSEQAASGSDENIFDNNNREQLDKALEALNVDASKLDPFDDHQSGGKWLHDNVHPLSAELNVEIGARIFQTGKDQFQIGSIVTSYDSGMVVMSNSVGNGNYVAGWHSHGSNRFVGDSLYSYNKFSDADMAIYNQNNNVGYMSIRKFHPFKDGYYSAFNKYTKSGGQCIVGAKGC
jgi:hypothetical protein